MSEKTIEYRFYHTYSIVCEHRGVAIPERSLELDRLAQRRLCDMQEHRYYSHYNSGTFDFTAARRENSIVMSECIAQAGGPNEALVYLIASPGHRRALLERGATAIGIAAGMVHIHRTKLGRLEKGQKSTVYVLVLAGNAE